MAIKTFKASLVLAPVALLLGTSAVSGQTTNPLTLGLFSTPEVPNPIQLAITGKIPKWISGSLYRGAQGAWDSGNYTSEHWFDGFSRNHRFEISNGKVEYRSRNASDELFDFIEATGLFQSGSFAGDPCKVIFGAFESTFREGAGTVGTRSTENIPVSYIVNFPGLASNVTTNHGPFISLTTTTDANGLLQINPTTLEPIELFTYRASSSALGAGRTASHPARDSRGWLFNYVLDPYSPTPEYKIFKIEETGTGHVIATITDAPAAYIHSVFSTTNYIILIVWQADEANPEKPTFNILDSLKLWDPERKTMFYVIDKVKGGVIAKYHTDPFFAFHEVNSFEDEKTGAIVVDLPTMPDYSFLEAARIQNLRAHIGQPNKTAKHDIPGSFRRYRLAKFANSKCENGTILERAAILDFEVPYKTGNIELPRINPSVRGKPYRYSYGVHIEKRGYFADSLIKIDTKTRRVKIWTPKVNHLPSEPIFVARPNARAEDDGVLLTVALDSKRKLSSLVVIDAQTMNEVGRAEMPIVMGYGFHGVWGDQ